MKICYARVACIKNGTALQTRRLSLALMQDNIDTSAAAGTVLARLCGVITKLMYVGTVSLEEICSIVGVSRTAFFRYLMSNGQQQGPARGNA